MKDIISIFLHINRMIKADPIDFAESLVRIVHDAERKMLELDRVLRKTDLILRGIEKKPREEEIKYDEKTVAEYLQRFLDYNDFDSLNVAYDLIMRYESCSFCRTMMASAKAEADYGNIEKAKSKIKEIINYLKS